MSGSRIEAGVPYFVRSREPAVVAEHLKEIKDAGCTYVVHFFTEFDQVFFKRSVGEIIARTKDLGLGVYLDPWSLGGIICSRYTLFPLDHPEACQMWSDGRILMKGCPNHPVLRDHVRRWLDDAAELEAETIFWDEPHLGLERDATSGAPVRWACRCTRCQELFLERYGKKMPVELTPEVIEFRSASLLGFFEEMTREAKARSLDNCLCLLPKVQPEDGFGDWTEIAALECVDIFGTDPYWYHRDVDMEAHVRHFSERIGSLSARHGKKPQIWLQGFGVPAGREREIERAGEVALEAGIANLAVWADRFGTGDNLRSANPQAVWEATSRLFRSLQTRGEVPM